MLKYRLITGPLLIVLCLAIIIADNRIDAVTLTGFWQDLFLGRDHPPRGLVIFGFCLLIVPLASYELSAIFRADGMLTKRRLTAAAALLGLLVSYSIPHDMRAIHAIAIVSTVMVILFVASLLTFSRHRNVKGVVAAAGCVMFAFVYLGLMLGFFLALRRFHSGWWIIGIILTTKACDTGAYFTGRAIGRHKLIPWLSPGKTWEGLIGGVVTAMLAGLGCAALSGVLPDASDHVPLWWGVVCGFLFAIIGQAGDLTMSLFKRGAGIKDSSSMLPGLGGILDVLDSPLMVAPVAYWLLTELLPATSEAAAAG